VSGELSLNPLEDSIDKIFMALGQFFVEDILNKSATMLSRIIEPHVVVVLFCEKHRMCGCAVASSLASGQEHPQTSSQWATVMRKSRF
jgi:hypothetical protein